MTTYAYQELPHHCYWHLVHEDSVKIEDGVMYIKGHKIGTPYDQIEWEPVYAYRTFSELLKAPVPCAMHIDQLNKLAH